MPLSISPEFCWCFWPFYASSALSITLPETNIAPENQWLEDYFPFGKPYFQGRTVSFREGNHKRWEMYTKNRTDQTRKLQRHIRVNQWISTHIKCRYVHIFSFKDLHVFNNLIKNRYPHPIVKIKPLYIDIQ